ncbi:MAG TPA: ABC transporter ATP-binding protein [Clostridiales bacterium]|nr:ABC transporter ATP-binding protein [Clostridiales bacterium]
MIKRFAGYYKPFIALFAADMLAALALAACDLFYPIITRRMIKVYIPEGMLAKLLVWAAVLLGLYLVKMGLNYFVSYYGHVMGVGMQADMRRNVFDHLQTLPLTYFDNNKTGTIMSRIINDLMDISELAHHGPEDIFISFVLLIGSFVIMSTIYLPLTLIVFASLPAMIVFAALKRKKMSEAFTEARVQIGEVNAGLENSISGIRVSRAYTNERFESGQFEEGNTRFVRARRRAYQAMGEFHAGTTFISDFLQVVMYVAGGLFFFYDKIDIADFTAFILYIGIFLNPVRRIISFVEQYQNGMTGFRRFCEIMDTSPEADTQGAVDIEKVRGNIEFCGVSFSYDDGKQVLHNISFEVEAGKTLALVGPSGGGKTTICHLIPRFYEISGGAVKVDGQDIRKFTRASLRRKIGIVAQDVFLFNATIYDNIAYGRPDATREEVEEAARLANIDEFIESLPEGYDTIVGERGIKLSGGQKQRVSIARVFLKNPPILILDEATSALDTATEIAIQKSLEQLSRGRTTIVVAHRLTTVRRADEILVVTDEGIVERGTHDELLERGGLYSSLWRGAAIR